MLIRFNELSGMLQLRLSGEWARFADQELRPVLALVVVPSVVWELAFASWMLLQPERINTYAQVFLPLLASSEERAGERGFLLHAYG